MEVSVSDDLVDIQASLLRVAVPSPSAIHKTHEAENHLIYSIFPADSMLTEWTEGLLWHCMLEAITNDVDDVISWQWWNYVNWITQFLQFTLKTSLFLLSVLYRSLLPSSIYFWLPGAFLAAAVWGPQGWLHLYLGLKYSRWYSVWFWYFWSFFWSCSGLTWPSEKLCNVFYEAFYCDSNLVLITINIIWLVSTSSAVFWWLSGAVKKLLTRSLTHSQMCVYEEWFCLYKSAFVVVVQLYFCCFSFIAKTVLRQPNYPAGILVTALLLHSVFSLCPAKWYHVTLCCVHTSVVLSVADAANIRSAWLPFQVRTHKV